MGPQRAKTGGGPRDERAAGAGCLIAHRVGDEGASRTAGIHGRGLYRVLASAQLRGGRPRAAASLGSGPDVERGGEENVERAQRLLRRLPHLQRLLPTRLSASTPGAGARADAREWAGGERARERAGSRRRVGVR